MALAQRRTSKRQGPFVVSRKNLQIKAVYSIKALTEVKHILYRHNHRQSFSSIVVKTPPSGLLKVKETVKVRDENSWETPFTYCLRAVTKLHDQREGRLVENCLNRLNVAGMDMTTVWKTRREFTLVKASAMSVIIQEGTRKRVSAWRPSRKFTQTEAFKMDGIILETP